MTPVAGRVALAGVHMVEPSAVTVGTIPSLSAVREFSFASVRPLFVQ
jgi:hypothetical protein